jgi:glycosyltransferase involved in cell wall biosynthesis
VDATSDASLLRQALRETRLDLMDVRRRIDTLTLESADGRSPAAVRVAAASLAYRSRQIPPHVSVITALYNHATYVERALDSVIAASCGDVEIIVVDDGSIDDSGRVVSRWIERNPDVQALLLEHPVNRGLPVSRNRAVAAAEGPLLFVLDADNEILAGGLEKLQEALEDDPGAWFAYGVLERFDEHGPNGLLGYLGWAPPLLRRGNYIDAMALVRADRMRLMGGYSTDRRLYGWEDYDLWCRMAEAGGYAAHVPNMVGRYRASATSMLSLSNLSLVPAWTALKEHCPTLFSATRPAD